MKIEIGESLGYSYFRHVKGCWLVQANWKPSEHWVKHMTDDALESLFQEMRRRFEPASEVFKGTKNSGQFLRQAEIDVVGIDQGGGVHAMEVAFHEAGLNYLGGSHIRVLKKLLRTKLVLDAYHPPDVKRTIYFVSPKVNQGVLQPLEEVFERLQQEYASVHWSLLTNERFTEEMLKPVLDKAETVADTSELFVRSAKLMKLAGGDWVNYDSRQSQGGGTDRRFRESVRESPRGGKFQRIVRGLMQTLLDGRHAILDDECLQNLTDPTYCQSTLELQLGGLALLRRREQGREISGRARYWSHLYGGMYYATNNWWLTYHVHNAKSLLVFIEHLLSKEQDTASVAALESHKKAIQHYLSAYP